MALNQLEQHELVVARLVKYLHELRADTKQISACLGYNRAIQGATEGFADAVISKYESRLSATNNSEKPDAV